MKKDLLNEINQIKFMFGYKVGKVLSEQDENKDKPFIAAGLQKVSEINLADGTYDTTTNRENGVLLPGGPASIWDLYIVDANNKWTGYIFRPDSGGMPRSGPKPQLEISNKQVTTRTGTIWYKYSQSTKQNDGENVRLGSALSIYLVKPGDNLTKIAKEMGVTVDEILKSNPQIKNKNKIFPGDKIQIEKF